MKIPKMVLFDYGQILIAEKFDGIKGAAAVCLGHIDGLTGWEEALGSGDVTATFSAE